MEGKRPARNVRHGMTAVEVLVASMLSALLMVAVMGTMRGLKAHERALDLRDPTTSWQRSLAATLQHDLDNARTIKIMPMFFELESVSGASDANSEHAWLPVTIRYEIRQADNESWLVRSERQGPNLKTELVCRQVARLRISQGAGDASLVDAASAQPLPAQLSIAFLQADGTPVFQDVFRQM